jgi:hypothetical protein
MHRTGPSDESAFSIIAGEGEGAHTCEAFVATALVCLSHEGLCKLCEKAVGTFKVLREVAKSSPGMSYYRVLESFKAIHHGIRGELDSRNGSKNLKECACG